MDATADGDRLLWRIVRYGGRWTPALAAIAVTGSAAELLLPAALGLAVDAALDGGVTRWPLVACGLVLVVVATDALGDLASGCGTARATARLRHHLIRHLAALDPRTAARHPIGDLVGRLVGQAADAGQAGATVVFGLTALLPPVGSVVALTLLEPLLGAVFVAGLIVLTILMRAFVADATAAVAGYQRSQGVIAGRLLEALGGARTIAAAGTVRPEIARVLDPLPQLGEHGVRTWRTLARAATRGAAVAPLLQLSIVAAGGWSVTAGWLTPGQLFAAVQYAALGSGLGGVVATLNRLVRTRAGARRAGQILAEPVQPYGTEILPAGGGALWLRGVTVRSTADRAILDGIDLRVPAGDTVAVVGASGAGKSTLAALAGRLCDPDAGEVLLDGVALRRLDRLALRRAVGYGFERPVLVGDTIADAIGLGIRPLDPPAEPQPGPAGSRPDEPGPGEPGPGEPGPGEPGPGEPGPGEPAGSSGAIRRAARAAAIDGFVERLPEGYRTRLADAPMSGGEAQRLGLARALHAERLLILDDATSSVDTATEHRIARAVAAHGDGRTRLIVTHRAATAAGADLVAWLDGGRLRAVGRHRDLWADPAYRAVFQPAPGAAGGAR
jgi:ATP-binding cassette subfamily B protein